MSIFWNSIQLAVFKATTVTKEFSKCHSRRWQLCPFPRLVSYWLLGSQDSHQRLLKMSGRLLNVAKQWQMMLFPGIVSNRSNFAVEIHFLEFLWI